jgi:hypothetical protein
MFETKSSGPRLCGDPIGSRRVGGYRTGKSVYIEWNDFE